MTLARFGNVGDEISSTTCQHGQFWTGCIMMVKIEKLISNTATNGPNIAAGV